MRKVLFIIAFSFAILNLSVVIVEAQLQGQARIDSLHLSLLNKKDGPSKVITLNEMSTEFSRINIPDSNLFYAEISLELARKINDSLGIADSYVSLTGALMNFGKNEESIKYGLDAIVIYDKLLNSNNNKLKRRILEGKGHAHNLIGLVYQFQGNYPQSLSNHYIALKIREEIKDKRGMAGSYNNIGLIHSLQNNYTKALKLFDKALILNNELGNKSWKSYNLGNIGSIYLNQGKNDEALKYFHEALKISQELGNKYGAGNSIGQIGLIYFNKKDYNQAIKYNAEARKYFTEIGFKNGVAISYIQLGKIYTKLKSYKKAYENLHIGLALTQELGAMEDIKVAYENLAVLDSASGNFEDAYSNYKNYIIYRDSITNAENTKILVQTQMQYEFDKKDALGKLEQEKKDAIAQKEIQRQKMVRNGFIGGLLVLIIMFIIAIIRFREKKKLSDKLALQNEEIETQKSIVEEKNEQIVASITYASTIQHAILPWDSVLESAFNDIFIIYTPKDIVSGDSYWFQEIDGIKFLAVIDCTGHGIPGSMLTVIASSVLDDAVLSKRLIDTGEILSYMNNKVTEVLNQRLAENQIRDGMELALIAIKDNKIQFSGAGRPLYLKNGTFEIIKTDKRGIAGQTENDEYQFSAIEIEKSENLLLYLTTDGFADQMNEESKKYSTKRFLQLLDSISVKTLLEQKLILENEFSDHKGDRNQIDDITILGVKI